ncbi:MAG: hypothetical protein R3F59_19555 [Myxococcota bacterium]
MTLQTARGGGLDDDELAQSLQSLGLQRDNYRAVALLPLIEVAWADGRIQRAERRRIAQIARDHDIPVDDAWLDRWLKRRPSKKAFFAARTVLLALMSRLGRDAAPIESVEQLLDLCLWVAESAGGLFGLAFTVSRSERECIEQIAGSLALGPALPDNVVSAWHEAKRRRNLAEAPTSHRRRQRYGILDQTTAHLDIWGKRTETLEEPADPHASTHLDLPVTGTVARIAVPVPSPGGSALPTMRGPGSPTCWTRRSPGPTPTTCPPASRCGRASRPWRAARPDPERLRRAVRRGGAGPAPSTYDEGEPVSEPSLTPGWSSTRWMQVPGARPADRDLDPPSQAPPPVPLGLRSITPDGGRAAGGAAERGQGLPGRAADRGRTPRCRSSTT